MTENVSRQGNYIECASHSMAACCIPSDILLLWLGRPCYADVSLSPTEPNFQFSVFQDISPGPKIITTTTLRFRRVRLISQSSTSRIACTRRKSRHDGRSFSCVELSTPSTQNFERSQQALFFGAELRLILLLPDQHLYLTTWLTGKYTACVLSSFSYFSTSISQFQYSVSVIGQEIWDKFREVTFLMWCYLPPNHVKFARLVVWALHGPLKYLWLTIH